MLNDLSQAVRLWTRQPALTALAVLSLALGIGANTAIFSVVNGVLLRPLPYRDAGRLVELWEESPERGWVRNKVSAANFLDWKEQARSFAGMAAYREAPLGLILAGDGDPERLQAGVVTADYFRVLGVASAAAGRTFLPAEDWRGESPVVVLSHDLWRRRFGASPDVVGQTLQLSGVGMLVAGVAPAGFRDLAGDVDLWTTLSWDPVEVRQSPAARQAHNLRAVARLAPGISAERAGAELAALAKRLADLHPDTNAGLGAGLTPLQEWVVGDVQRPLVILLGAVGFVLLIACANVGSLLLAHTAARSQEIAVRSALGARRGRLVRQLLTESLVLSVCGGIAGFLLGFWALRGFLALGSGSVPRLSEVGLDLWVLAFTVAVTLLTAGLFGLLPAFGASAVDMSAALKDGGAKTAGTRSARSRNLLVVVEFALAVILVVCAGLLLRSFRGLLDTDPGFETERLLTARIDLPRAAYREPARVEAFYRQLLPRLAALPGVESAAAASNLPLTADQWTSDFALEGRPREEYGVDVRHTAVTPDYFRAMGMTLVAGRALNAMDRAETVPSLVVNETLARRYFPAASPLGKRIAFDRYPDDRSVWWTIVGVVRDQKQGGLAAAVQPEVFKPHLQWPQNPMTLILRGETADPLALAGTLRAEVRAVDPNLPVFEVRTMEQVLAGSMAQNRFITLLLAIFAGIALVQAAVGLYAVLGYSVSLRTREIGIRMALGGRAADVLGLVVRQGMVLVAAGLAFGLAAALGLTRSMAALLYEVSPLDPVTFGVVAFVLVLVGLLACYLPARRATRVHPGTVLRGINP